jgi:hypothetical protein
MTPNTSHRRPFDPHAVPEPLRPGVHLGAWPVDPALRARIRAANEAGFDTALDGPELSELLQAAETLRDLV